LSRRPSRSQPPSRRRTTRTAGNAVTPRRNAPELEVIVASDLWRGRRTAKAVVKKAVLAAAEAISTPSAELAIVLSDDSAIRALNRDWRGKNAPTNVLSFPAAPNEPARPAAPRRGGRKFHKSSPYIGDIIIAYQTTAREAVAEGKPFNHHLAHLAIHGFLHLLGYDHENDRDAEEMENLERRILERLAVPDPYAPRESSN
jgi:probable rRNA maturation factor